MRSSCVRQVPCHSSAERAVVRRMRAFVVWLGLAALATLSGCAVGNTYEYRLQSLPLPVTGTAAVGVGVNDARPYVANRDKEAKFVGLQRGGFGNPFDVTTTSGRPLGADMQETLVRGLAARGYKAAPVELAAGNAPAVVQVASASGLTRVVQLEVREWKSDAMVNITLHYDLTLRVFDAAGTVLGEASTRKEEGVGASAAIPSNNSPTVGREFERVVGGLFSAPDIRRALDGS